MRPTITLYTVETKKLNQIILHFEFFLSHADLYLIDRSLIVFLPVVPWWAEQDEMKRHCLRVFFPQTEPHNKWKQNSFSWKKSCQSYFDSLDLVFSHTKLRTAHLAFKSSLMIWKSPMTSKYTFTSAFLLSRFWVVQSLTTLLWIVITERLESSEYHDLIIIQTSRHKHSSASNRLDNSRRQSAFQG